MPTFETDSPKPANKGDNGAQGGEFRPRRRDGRKPRAQEENFTPPSIPPEVKDRISARIGEIVRQSRGPDERMFAFREFISSIRRVIFGLPDIFRSLFSRAGDDRDEDSAEETLGETTSQPNNRKSRNDQQRNHRGGRRRRGRRSGGGGHPDRGRDEAP